MGATNSLSERFSVVWRGLLRSFLDFPVEAFLSVSAFVLALLSNEQVMEGDFPIVYFFPLVVLSFCLHRISERKGSVGWKIGYFVSAFLGILVFVWRPELGTAAIVVVYLLSFILLFAAGGWQDNEQYAATILHCLVKGGAAVLVAGVLSLVLLAIISSVDSLFLSRSLSEKWYIYPQMFVWMVIAPMLCCAFVSEPQAQWKGLRFLEIIVDYVLTPALLIYSVILYAYMLRILIQWKLPDGGVAYLVGGFVGVALVCRLLQTLVAKPHFEGFYRCFPYIAIGPLVLLWIGVARRIGEYGLTEMRIYLVAVSLLLTLFSLFLLWPRTRSFFRMSLITGGLAVLLTFIPGISAHDLGIRSQRARQENVPQENGEFPKSGTDVIAVDAVDVYDLKAPVPLDGYTLLLPESAYHYYEDNSIVVFYEDDSREKELLRCEIVVRLDSSNPEKLVYQNDKYLAVFTSITDYHHADVGPAFMTAGHTLYTRP